MSTKRTVLGFVFVCAFMLASGSASAQDPSGFGVRAGASADPDQFYIGAHVDVKEVYERLWFRPNAEIGFGDDITLFTLNGEFVYRVRIRSQEWIPYFGGGPALVIGSFRNGPTGGRDTDVGGGFNFVGGIQQMKGLMAEIKLGAIDSPDFKIGVGWRW